MGTRVDFLNWLDPDVSLKILMCFEDPSDLVRIGCVSRSWRRLVIENCVCKHLCLRTFPPLHRVDRVIEPCSGTTAPSEVGCSKFVEYGNLEKEHRAYAFLARGCISFALRKLISDAISASSTDNYPRESVWNTLEPNERVRRRASYWSSKGQSDPAVPEKLVYKMVSDICVITEISIKPFQAYFEWGFPIYSAKAVRFRMGHLKLPADDPMSEPSDNFANENFVWTYTSPVFPMAQKNRSQKFKLPEPVLCIGGILQIELLGRVQREEIDGLFYICICHVEAVGRSLSPAFDIDILEPSGKFVLKAQNYSQPSLPDDQARPVQPLMDIDGYLRGNVRHLEMIVNMLQGGVGVDFERFEWMDD